MTPDAHFEVLSAIDPSDRLRGGGEWIQVFSCTEITIARVAQTEIEA